MGVSILNEYKERIGYFSGENVLDKPFPALEINEKTREIFKEFAKKCRGGVRLRAGFVYTNEERKRERERLLNVKVPSL
jgi:hypothetical protein